MGQRAEICRSRVDLQRIEVSNCGLDSKCSSEAFSNIPIPAMAQVLQDAPSPRWAGQACNSLLIIVIPAMLKIM